MYTKQYYKARRWKVPKELGIMLKADKLYEILLRKISLGYSTSDSLYKDNSCSTSHQPEGINIVRDPYQWCMRQKRCCVPMDVNNDMMHKRILVGIIILQLRNDENGNRRYSIGDTSTEDICWLLQLTMLL